MDNKEKRNKIKELTEELLSDSFAAMVKKIDKVIYSGVINIDSWDEDCNPMTLPKCIAIALLQDESRQYDGTGTSFEKQVKKEVTRIRYLL